MMMRIPSGHPAVRVIKAHYRYSPNKDNVVFLVKYASFLGYLKLVKRLNFRSIDEVQTQSTNLISWLFRIVII